MVITQEAVESVGVCIWLHAAQFVFTPVHEVAQYLSCFRIHMDLMLTQWCIRKYSSDLGLCEHRFRGDASGGACSGLGWGCAFGSAAPPSSRSRLRLRTLIGWNLHGPALNTISIGGLAVFFLSRLRRCFDVCWTLFVCSDAAISTLSSWSVSVANGTSKDGPAHGATSLNSSWGGL